MKQQGQSAMCMGKASVMRQGLAWQLAWPETAVIKEMRCKMGLGEATIMQSSKRNLCI